VRRDSLALLAGGVLIGALLVSPVGAHVTDSLNHLWTGDGHIKDKVTALGDDRWAPNAHNHNQSYMRFSGKGVLPSNKSLTGSFGDVGSGQDFIGGPISFAVPIDFSPTVILEDAAPDNENCPGSASDPKAEPGYLCVYPGYSFNITNSVLNGWYGASNGSSTCDNDGCRNGIMVYADVADPSEYAEISGSWAVTAP
jgi:hypothetical protein